MPAHMRRLGGTYVRCQDWHTGAFAVSDETATAWESFVAAQGRQPRVGGYPVRPYPAFDVEAHAPYARDGIYTDHGSRDVQLAAYALRDRLGDDREALRLIATRMGFRHWRDAYNAVRNEGRRRTAESGRDADGNLRWRAWNGGYAPSRQAIRTTAVAAAAAGTRRFGIEVEFMHANYGTLDADRAAITRDARAAGLTFVDRWGSYHRDMSRPGWQGTYDASVTGGEIISDILTGDDASLDEVSVILRAVKAHNGQAARGQGLHVHHDASDFTLADKVRLVDNLAAVQDHLLAYVPEHRFTATAWCKRLGAAEWALVRRSVAAGSAGFDRYLAFNFNHLFARSPRVEFRALGHTLHAGKVRAWVRVGQAVMAATKAGVVFTPGLSRAEMLATLRQHGLSGWAAERFEQVCSNRATGVAARRAFAA